MKEPKKISDAQKKILIYLYKVRFRTDDGVPSTTIGTTVGEALKTSDNTNKRKSAWASPKCQSLKASGLVEQLPNKSYRITQDGWNYTNKYLLNGYERMNVVELLNEFAREVQSDMKEISNCVDSKIERYSSFNWINKIVNWVRGLFK